MTLHQLSLLQLFSLYALFLKSTDVGRHIRFVPSAIVQLGTLLLRLLVVKTPRHSLHPLGCRLAPALGLRHAERERKRVAHTLLLPCDALRCLHIGVRGKQ